MGGTDLLDYSYQFIRYNWPLCQWVLHPQDSTSVVQPTAGTKYFSRADETAQRVKGLTAKPDHVSLIPTVDKVGGETWLLRIVLWPPHWSVCILTPPPSLSPMLSPSPYLSCTHTICNLTQEDEARGSKFEQPKLCNETLPQTSKQHYKNNANLKTMQCHNYLYNIYTILETISNLDMIWSLQENLYGFM